MLGRLLLVVGSRLRLRGIEYLEAGEISPIESAIARQQALGLNERMSADQEIGYHPLALAPAASVKVPSRASRQRCLQAERTKLHPQAVHGILRRIGRWKQTSHFGPDHLASYQLPLCPATVQGGF